MCRGDTEEAAIIRGEMRGAHTGVEPAIYWKTPANTVEFIEIWWNKLVCVSVCVSEFGW